MRGGTAMVQSDRKETVPDRSVPAAGCTATREGVWLVMYSIRASELHIRGKPAIRGTPAGRRQERHTRKNGRTLIRAVSQTGTCPPVLLAQVQRWCGILGHQDGINGTHRLVRAPDYAGDASDDDYHQWLIPGNRAIHFAQKLQWRMTRFRINRRNATRC